MEARRSRRTLRRPATCARSPAGAGHSRRTWAGPRPPVQASPAQPTDSGRPRRPGRTPYSPRARQARVHPTDSGSPRTIASRQARDLSADLYKCVNSPRMVTQHTDVLIIGAGLSGVGAACHLRREMPETTFTILEKRDTIGGTWDLFRYPGVRSDSDMYTLGYRFKPWPEQKAIADGPSILRYVKETAAEYDVERHIRYRHEVIAAEWSSDDAKWRVTAEHDGKKVEFTCNFLWSCSGYYDYENGYTPQFDGVEDFTGTVVHPQHWPSDLDYRGKRVIVIGSGATAVTLVPAMAMGDNAAEHVTMLQRSPTYIFTAPSQDPLANLLRKVLPEE